MNLVQKIQTLLWPSLRAYVRKETQHTPIEMVGCVLEIYEGCYQEIKSGDEITGLEFNIKIVVKTNRNEGGKNGTPPIRTFPKANLN